MRRFRRWRLSFPLPGRLPRWGLLLLLVGYLLLRLLDRMLWGPLTVIAEHEARNRGIHSVNQVVFKGVGLDLKQSDLVTYTKDNDGRIAAYQVNTQVVNRVAHDAARAVQQEYLRLSDDTFHVPLGQLTGSQVLSTHGPRIPVQFIPMGSVTTEIRQEFKTEGINQTRHRIWLHTAATVRVIMPLISKEVLITSDLPITETVIVGPVPNSLYGGNLGGVSLPASQ